MAPDMIINIVQIVVYVILGGLAVYFQTNTKLKSFVNDYIVRAEEYYKSATKAGGMKMEFVIDKLYELIPIYMKSFFPRELVQAIVQNAFDAVQDYAKQALDKAAEFVVDKVEDISDGYNADEETIDDVIQVTPYD